MRHILSFSAEPILRLTCQKHFGNHPKKAFVMEISLFQIFLLL